MDRVQGDGDGAIAADRHLHVQEGRPSGLDQFVDAVGLRDGVIQFDGAIEDIDEDW
jgi:hypothetical protein